MWQRCLSSCLAPFKTFTHSLKTAWGVGGIAGLALASVLAYRYSVHPVEPLARPDGDPKTSKTRWLGWGSKIFQTRNPLCGTYIYFAGFHTHKEDLSIQHEVHHYCKQVNEDFAQCLLYDGNTSNANLTGIEYVISEKLYRQLPPDECLMWHPHNFEILSGQLLTPGLPSPLEKRTLERRLNTYGKTYHTWNVDFNSLDTLPKGEAKIGWSVNQGGELRTTLLDSREKVMGVKTSEKRVEREPLAAQAKPQSDVNATISSKPN